jgi:hypothetical protein
MWHVAPGSYPRPEAAIMDPMTYCQQSIAELLEGHARSGPDPGSLQRAVVLSYLAELRLPEPAFTVTLGELTTRPAYARWAGVAAAARAILDDWEARRGLAADGCHPPTAGPATA